MTRIALETVCRSVGTALNRSWTSPYKNSTLRAGTRLMPRIAALRTRCRRDASAPSLRRVRVPWRLLRSWIIRGIYLDTALVLEGDGTAIQTLVSSMANRVSDSLSTAACGGAGADRTGKRATERSIT